MSITLGSRIEGSSRPSFQASIDGEFAIIELDSGAVLKLAERVPDVRLNRILDSKQDKIRDAAERLFRDGFVTKSDKGLEILITALDL